MMGHVPTVAGLDLLSMAMIIEQKSGFLAKTAKEQALIGY